MPDGTAVQSSINYLLDTIIRSQQLKNDAALARSLDLSAPVISKLRHGRMPLGATVILSIHEAFDMPIREIKALAGMA